MARYNKTNVTTGDTVKSDVNVQLGLIETAIADTLSRKGDTPNTMEVDIDLNSNDILNVNSIKASSIDLNGQVVTSIPDVVYLVGDIKYYDTMALATADTTLASGDKAIITERANALFEVKTGLTANGYNIVDHDTLALQFDLITDTLTDAKAFGAVYDGVTDDTLPMQAFLDTQPLVWELPDDSIVVTGELEIKSGISIKGNRTTFKPTGNSIFAVKSNIAGMVSIEGFDEPDWGSPTGTVGKEFFHNISDGGDGATGYHVGTEYDIEKLIIQNNKLGISKITSLGDTYLVYKDNESVHAAGVASAPYYLLTSRGTTDELKGSVRIYDNKWDVYPPDGSNVDIVKITGGIEKAYFKNNEVVNNNTLSAAQVDVFTGGHKIKVKDNDFTNIELHVKRVQGALVSAPVYQQYANISGNTWDMQDGFLGIRALLNEVTRSNIYGNTFIMRHTTVESEAIRLEVSDVNLLFGSKEVSATIISSNMFDMQGVFADSHAVKHSPSSPVGKGLVLSNNLLIGAQRLVAGGTEFSATMGNVWLDSGGATGTSMNNSAGSVVLGNVADTTTPVFSGSAALNNVTQSLVTISAADTTPTVNLSDFLKITNSSTITDFDDGYVGQSITIFGAPCTIQHNANIKLNGSANFSMTTFQDTLTLRKRDSSTWVEISRTIA